MKEDIKKTELKKTVKWAKPVKSVKQGLKMYIGPGIRGIVQKNHIVQEADATLLESAQEKYPEIKRLIIPVERLAQARIEIKQPGTYLHEIYARLANKA
ncbi:MAG: hypothetical protein PHQ85_07060 [Eubacteriales bacterium]|jgi:hypothetical protein|nr:hypothetical protein [Eubacteriales bacterium]MDD4711419.1 hypothetical protein [Eubacteriales bacterium]